MATLGTFVAGQVLTAAELNDIGTWTTYNPTLTATPTSPTLGTGSTITGQYVRLNDLVIGRVHIIFGTSGVAAGSGTYRISLPVTPTTDTFRLISGSAWCYDATVTTFYSGQFSTDVGGTYGLINIDGISPSTVTNAVPFTWAANDQIRVQFTYQAA